jgi:hypothetical protein
MGKARAKAMGHEKPQKPILSFSDEAKRVLDSLCCDHDCRNCIVCTRINLHVHENAVKEAGNKKMIRVQKSIPVTDRVPNPTTADEDHTVRPRRDPGVALAVTLKYMHDELAHLERSLAAINEQYDKVDPSMARRQSGSLYLERSKAQQAVHLKKRQIYDLHDVLEGQKASGQAMDLDAIDITAMSIMSPDQTSNGIVD